MNFQNFIIPALFYIFILYSTVVCRISDKRKCADADCSEPISLAKTLLRYNADDDRLLSFPRNIKIKVFSKEAGDNPHFWEVEEEGSNKCMNFQGSRQHFLDVCKEVVYGKRGYVPKGLLREEKVLIPSDKLTHIVPTGRIGSAKQNATDTNPKEPESDSVNLLSETPKLPVANSKGWFSTIGGVSADSVPMNSPDIKPQSTREFQVLDGTTVYDDVVSDKPESHFTTQDNTVNINQDSKQPGSNEITQGSKVPSSDIKPVNEESYEHEPSIKTDQNIKKEVDKIIVKDENSKKESEDIRNQPKEGSAEINSGTYFFGDFVNKMSNYISSGAGESVTEEEGEEEEQEDEGEEEEEEGEDGDDEGSAEEDYKDGEENNKTEDLLEGKDIKDQPQTKDQSSEPPLSNTSEAPSFSNILEEGSNLKSGNTLESEKHDGENQEVDELADTNINLEVSKNAAEEAVESSSCVKTNVDVEIKSVEQDNLPKISEEKEEMLTKPKVDQLEPELTQSSHLPKEEIIEPAEEKEFKIASDSVSEQTPKDVKKIIEELKTEDKSARIESNIEPAKGGIDEALTVDVTSDSKEAQVQEQLRGDDEVHVQEQLKPKEPEDQEQKPIELEYQEQPKDVKTQDQGEPKTDKSEVHEQPKADESQIQEQPKTDETEINEKLKTDELQIKEQSKTIEPQFHEHSEDAAKSSLSQPIARQFLYSSGQLKEGSPVENKYETSESLPSDLPENIKKEVKPLNETAQGNLPPIHPTYSPLPSMQSPKYASVVSRRIQSSESSSANEIVSQSEEEEDSDAQVSNTIGALGSIPIHDETVSPSLLLQSQSPKYSSVVSNRIGPLIHSGDMKSDVTPETPSEFKSEHPESSDVPPNEKKLPVMPTIETVGPAEVTSVEEIESKEGTLLENNEVPLQESEPPSYDVPSAGMVKESLVETAPEEGMFSWVTPFLFGSKDSNSIEESPTNSENSDPSQMAHFAENTCSADGVEGSCATLRDTIQQEVTWQEASYTSDMWELLDRVPLEATIWLIITAVVVLIFSLGHYYIEAHRRDGPLVAIINKLEREVLILKKEKCIMEDRLHIAEQQVEAWNTSSSENDALLMELKQELEETKVAKAELEEQAAQLKEELETVTESGLEMHRLLEESLSSQDGSQVLLSTVETLREKLQRQEEEISGLSDTLSSKNAEVEELQGKLAHSAEVARSLEDKVISVTRAKEEELLQMRDKHRELISQLEEVMETKALEETRLSTEMSKLRLTIEELQKTLAEKDSELDTLKEVVKQLRATDSNEKIEALFDVVGVQAKLKTAVAERDDFREKFLEEEGARKLLEGHMMKITQEVAELKNNFETAEKEKIEALTKLQVLSNYFKEKESQLQKELGLQESMWLQKQSDDHTIYEQMRSLREENEKYKLQNESLKKEIVEQEASFKIQLANTEQKAHENWVASRQSERKLKEAQQEAAQLRNRLTTVEKNSANYSLDEKPNISESNGDPSSPPPSLMFPPTTSPPFMMYGPPIPPPGDFVPPPPLMGSPYPSDSRPPPLGRISSPPLDHRFSPPPPLPYPPYDYPPYGHHSPSPPPPMPPHHRNVHKPQPRDMSREQKDHVPNYSPEAEKTSRRNKR